MDFTNIKTQLTYRIEPQAGGGFIARPSDPNAPSIEGSTREEVQQKIRAKAFAAVADRFPALKELLEKQLMNSSDGSSPTVLRSTEPVQVITTVTSEGNHFDLDGFLKKNFPGLSVVVQETVNGKTVTSNSGQTQGPDQATLSQAAPSNIPIVPEASSRWPWVIFALLIVASVAYFFLSHH